MRFHDHKLHVLTLSVSQAQCVFVFGTEPADHSDSVATVDPQLLSPPSFQSQVKLDSALFEVSIKWLSILVRF